MSQSTPLDARVIAAIYPSLNPQHLETITLAQIVHRIELINFWDIKTGEKVVEIGCGQGDCTVTLATAVGGAGHVTAIDPASLDYGSPLTLGQAQAHLKASPVGSRITFVQADPVTFLHETTAEYTTAVIAHCIWYFSSPSVLQDILTTLAGRVQRICIAEYNLTATDPRSVPHLLSALTQASMECRKPESISNIRTVLSPAAIHASAIGVGLTLQEKYVFTPNEGMLDGKWEVDAVSASSYVNQIQQYVKDEREKAVVIAMRDSVLANSDALEAKGEKVKTMDLCAFVYTTPVVSATI